MLGCEQSRYKKTGKSLFNNIRKSTFLERRNRAQVKS